MAKAPVGSRRKEGGLEDKPRRFDGGAGRGLGYAHEAAPTMDTYLEVVKRLPRPTAAQIDGFVVYVCGANSWYKHIPLTGPGTTFRLFVNPYVTCEVVSQRDGRVEYRERAKQGFHYNQWPTQEYREKCGYLDYRHSSESVPAVYLVQGPPTEKALRELKARAEKAQRVLARRR